MADEFRSDFGDTEFRLQTNPRIGGLTHTLDNDPFACRSSECARTDLLEFRPTRVLGIRSLVYSRSGLLEVWST